MFYILGDFGYCGVYNIYIGLIQTNIVIAYRFSSTSITDVKKNNCFIIYCYADTEQ